MMMMMLMMVCDDDVGYDVDGDSGDYELDGMGWGWMSYLEWVFFLSNELSTFLFSTFSYFHIQSLICSLIEQPQDDSYCYG